MTREEAIAFFKDMNECTYGNLEAVEMAIKALEQEPRWIPITERLPEESTAVLVWCPERKNIYCAYYEEKRWWIFGAYWEEVNERVIAWMPMPPSPQLYKEV